MGLIPVPFEGVYRQVKAKKINKIIEIRAKLEKKNLNAEEKLIRKICDKLIEYQGDKNKFNLKETDMLIDEMELCILKIKKRRLELQKKRK